MDDKTEVNPRGDAQRGRWDKKNGKSRKRQISNPCRPGGYIRKRHVHGHWGRRVKPPSLKVGEEWKRQGVETRRQPKGVKITSIGGGGGERKPKEHGEIQVTELCPPFKKCPKEGRRRPPALRRSFVHGAGRRGSTVPGKKKGEKEKEKDRQECQEQGVVHRVKMETKAEKKVREINTS